MKKIVSVILCLASWLALLFPTVVSAAGAAAHLSGPDAVRAGDTISLTFYLNGSGIYGASGALSYDSSQLTLSQTKQTMVSGWAVEFNDGNFIAYDNELTNPINGSTALFTVTFQVNSDLDAGVPIHISCTDVTASDGTSDYHLGTVSYSVTLDVLLPSGTASIEPSPEHEDAPSEPETRPTQTVSSATTPADPAPQEGNDSYLWLLIAACLISLAAGVCAGSAINRKSGRTRD